MRFARPTPTLPRPTIIDVVIVSTLGAAALLGALVEDLHPSAGVVRRLDPLGGLLIVGMTLPLALRRRFPRAVAIGTVGCATAAIVLGYPGAIGLLGALFALGSLAYTTTRRDTLLIGIPAGVTLLTAFVAAPGSGSLTNVAANLLVIASTLLIGDLLRTRRDQNVLLAERNRELEALRETETRAAIVEERMRIAREVHDVVGHSLVAITLQARAGLRRLSRSPERAGQALREIETLASRALEETRAAVATIRSGTGVTAPRTQPTLADLPDLLESTRGPELEVRLVVDPAAHQLGAPLQSAAYRIVQESLSNAAKHARPARTEVRITNAGGAFTVEVTDDSPNAAPAAGDGSGLRGMRERAEQLGGTLEAGPTPDRGWRVRARFPVEGVTT
jgi:signal transduction histidine kinase